jgi:hypothetical protein
MGRLGRVATGCWWPRASVRVARLIRCRRGGRRSGRNISGIWVIVAVGGTVAGLMRVAGARIRMRRLGRMSTFVVGIIIGWATFSTDIFIWLRGRRTLALAAIVIRRGGSCGVSGWVVLRRVRARRGWVVGMVILCSGRG